MCQAHFYRLCVHIVTKFSQRPTEAKTIVQRPSHLQLTHLSRALDASHHTFPKQHTFVLVFASFIGLSVSPHFVLLESIRNMLMTPTLYLPP